MQDQGQADKKSKKDAAAINNAKSISNHALFLHYLNGVDSFSNIRTSILTDLPPKVAPHPG
ncbi:hypothetical protein [Arenibacter echinorum]|uniref:hypothetical protein n=1 Tax=Arenibacter echinorum TaxID=440515 RepID=UPI000DB994B1|nr:hypothetical protein [Arenibacter echinorum]